MSPQSRRPTAQPEPSTTAPAAAASVRGVIPVGSVVAPGSAPAVEVRTSTRRRKYATAFWQGSRIVVVLPARMPRREHQAMVDQLVARVLRHRPNVAASDADLAARAEQLADRYLGGVRAASVRWSSHQRRRWGSCSLETREIRISELLRPAPPWVVDAVLVHELAHLVEHGHGREFRALVARFERTSDADAFLAGYALGLDQVNASSPGFDTSDEPIAACEPGSTAGALSQSSATSVVGPSGEPPASELPLHQGTRARGVARPRRMPSGRRRRSAPGSGDVPLF